MRLRIEWVIESCRLLAQIGEEFERTRPVRGPAHRHGHPPRAEDRRAAPDARARRGRGDLDREPQHDPAGGARLPRRPRRPPGRCADLRSGGARLATCARCSPPSRSSCSTTAATSSSAGSSSPYEGLVGGTEETTSGRMRLEPLRDAAEPPDPGHQRQPDQAVRREPARRRPEHRRVVPAHHEPLDERQARHRVRLRRLRPRCRRALPQRVRRGLGRRDRPGHAARGAARRVRRAGQGRRARVAPTS